MTRPGRFQDVNDVNAWAAAFEATTNERHAQTSAALAELKSEQREGFHRLEKSDDAQTKLIASLDKRVTLLTAGAALFGSLSGTLLPMLFRFLAGGSP